MRTKPSEKASESSRSERTMISKTGRPPRLVGKTA
ncbi:hypothetical protein HNQ95_003883 [Aminobacter ciceronei]|uniref:Uncharacterized protein n=1 Tax=Aminobacter ciceronei TaxID=150723 RepID=A0ABR6CB07_9HYPH|nr:hypothetical protein [Aminobacter ciceronei]MBA9021921.1 hypothetical protein [Aminobacter ciceronei]